MLLPRTSATVGEGGTEKALPVTQRICRHFMLLLHKILRVDLQILSTDFIGGETLEEGPWARHVSGQEWKGEGTYVNLLSSLCYLSLIFVCRAHIFVKCKTPVKKWSQKDVSRCIFIFLKREHCYKTLQPIFYYYFVRLPEHSFAKWANKARKTDDTGAWTAIRGKE